MNKLALLVLLVGCEAGITSDAQPRVSVFAEAGECYAPIGGDPIDPTLGVAGTCPFRLPTQLFAGIDRVKVVVDYGPDVPFARSTTAPPPDITVTIDGVVSDEPIEISNEFRIGGRAYFIASFTVPDETSSDVRISAGVNAGFQTLVPDVFSTIAAPVFMSLLECQGAPPCQLFGAVGSAHIRVSTLGTIPQLVTIHSSLDGVPQPDPIPPVRTFPSSVGGTEAITGVPIPAASDDTNWVLSAELGEAVVWEVSAVIRAPEITARLTCGTTCALASGDPIGLEILAPSQIRPLEALVTTRLDGNPQLVSVRVPLEQRADGTALGLLGLTSPAGSGSWQIDVTVAGYAAPTIVTTVQ